MCTMQRHHRVQSPRHASLLAQLLDLCLIELTNWRWSWRSMLLTSTLAPVFSILALNVFARDSGREALAYILTGNVVISQMFGNMDNVQNHFVFMRFRGVLDYFATLPVHRFTLVLAVVASFLLLSLPSLVITLLLGSLVLHISIRPHPLTVLVVPMCAIPLSGIGALIGTSVRTPQEGGAISLVLTMVLAALGPVVVPPDRLPQVMIVLGRLSPATYAASALRQALLGQVTGRILLDLLFLLGVTIVVFWGVGRKMDWRQR